MLIKEKIEVCKLSFTVVLFTKPKTLDRINSFIYQLYDGLMSIEEYVNALHRAQIFCECFWE